MSRRRFGLTGSVALACGLLALSASGGPALAGAGRSNAIEAPAVVNSISCAAVGECAAGGYYLQGYVRYFARYHSYFQGSRRVAFVVSKTNGSWGNPVPMPSSSISGDADVEAISCAAAGECAAGGYFAGRSAGEQAFVVSETNGTWGKAVAVPGMATLNAHDYAEVTSISCPAAGNCAAGGYYTDGNSNDQAFVVGETNGVWGKAIEVPGTAALNTRGYAGVDSVSCAAAGECAAGGFYTTHGQGVRGEAFVVSEANGVWSDAIEVPGMATLNAGGDAELISISCSAAGDCAAGGYYADGRVPATYQAFVVGETNHTWGDAVEVPGTATLNSAGNASANAIACPATGECAAGGFYTDGSGHQRGFVVAETNGTWGDAIGVPGLAALSRYAAVDSISCAAPGDCAAAGDYKQRRADNGGRYGAAFVVSEMNGTWGNALTVPGTVSLNSSGAYNHPAASADSISCAAAGECAAGGHWVVGSAELKPRARRPRAFVFDETNGNWGNPVRVRNLLTRCVVPDVVRKRISGTKRALRDFGCRLGKVTWARSNREQGRVIAQQPEIGAVLRAGARVAITVSRGN